MGKNTLGSTAAAVAATLLLVTTSTRAQEAPLPPVPLPPAAPAAAAPVPPAARPDDAAIRAAVDAALKKRDDDAKKKDEEKKLAGFVVGEDRKLNVTFDDGGLRYKSADGAFDLHVGGRLMSDFNAFTQTQNLKRGTAQTAAQELVTGTGPGIGNLQDGFFIRRARAVADGTFYQTFEFKTEFDFENYNSLTFDEMYLGVKDLPFVDTVRVGQAHVPFGLEAYTSSRWLPTMERSQLFDAFYQEFAPGVFTNTTFADQRITTQHMFHRIDNFAQFNGDAFGDGKFAYSGRVSALPIYEDNGRHLLHVAVDYQWRKGSTPAEFNGGTTLPAGSPPNATTANSDLVRFRARQGLRDAIGAEGDGARVVDTGNVFASHVNAVNPELLFYWGPFWFQSEATWAHVSDAYYPVPAAAAGAAPAVPPSATTARGDLDYWGVYAEAGYFLTGENRGYDKRFGKPGRVVPLENFFLVKDGDGCYQHGLGAWEVVYRYSHVNLNSNAVYGGIYDEHTVGLNWYWTPNAKVQFNYIVGTRAAPDGTGGTNGGVVQGFGVRTALEF